MKLIDLSIPIGIGTPAWPTYEPLQMKYFKRLAPTGANGQTLTHSNHVGTHLDGEIHFHPPGKDIAGLSLDYLVGPGVIVTQSISPDLIPPPCAQVRHVQALAVPIVGSLLEIGDPAILGDSTYGTEVFARLPALPSSAGAVYVRFWADAYFPASLPGAPSATTTASWMH